MFTEPRLTLAGVSPFDRPSVSLSVVRVSTDRRSSFAIEGPDPAHHNAGTRRPLTGRQAKNANAFLSPVDTEAIVDLTALAACAETGRIAWTVARHEQHHGSVDLRHHTSRLSARRRFEPLESAIWPDRGQTWPAPDCEVVASVHRGER